MVDPRLLPHLATRGDSSVEEPRLARHQLAAARRLVVIVRRFGGALLCDEAGLGKTWTAVAVAREWQHAGRTSILAPRILVPMWSSVAAQFSLECEVRSHDELLHLDFLSGETGGGIVVVDEAHRFRNALTQRYDALARFTAARPLLLVTATPVCNSLRDLQALLDLFLPDDGLRIAGVPSIAGATCTRDHEQLCRIADVLIVRRDRSVLPESLGFGELETVFVRAPLPDRHEEIVSLINSLSFPLLPGSTGAAMLRSFLRRRLESSIAALRDTVSRQRRFCLRAQEALSAGRSLTRADYRDLFGGDEGPWFQDLLFPQMFFAEGGGDPAALRAETAVLDRLLAVSFDARERKIELLRSLLPDSRTVVFCGAVATAQQMYELLRSERRCALMSAGRSRDPHGAETSAEVAVQLLQRGMIDVLIATDLASEGLDLQEAGTVIHYDLPWNPLRIEQRNGRIHRIGQRLKLVRSIWLVPSVAQETELRSVRIIRRKRELMRMLFDEQSLARNACVDSCVLGGTVAPEEFASRDLAAVRTSDMSWILTPRRPWTDDPRAWLSAGGDSQEEDIAAVREEWVQTLRSRSSIPALVSVSHLRLARRLAEEGLGTQVVRGLLRRQHTAGIERIIEAASSDVLDEARVEALVRLLAGSERLTRRWSDDLASSL